MSSIEFTKTFSFEATSSGLTGNQYLYLGSPLGSVFVVKYLNAVSSTGFNYVDNASIYVKQADDTAGTNLTEVILFTTDVANNANNAVNIVGEDVHVFDDNSALCSQIILTKPYLVINANAISSGTIYVTISFLVFANTSSLTANFGASYGTAAVGTTSIYTPTTTNATKIKSLIISNFDDTVNNYDVQLVVLDSSNVIQGYLSNIFTVYTYNSYTFGSIIYFSTTSPGEGYKIGLVITSTGTDNLYYYLSTTTDPYA